MRTALRTIFCITVGVALLAAVAIAQSSASTDKTKPSKTADQQHHSKLSRAAFWRHHKDAAKDSKQPKNSKQTKTSKAQAEKPTKGAQLKQVSAKTTSKNDQKPMAHSKKESKQPQSAQANKVSKGKATSAKSSKGKSTTTKSAVAKKTKTSKSPTVKKASARQKQQPQTVAVKQ